ncbi:acetyltransferase [compost metagenome]
MSTHISELTLEQLSIEDTAGLLQLTTHVQWDYSEQEVHTLLKVGTIFGHRNPSGQIVSSAAILPYGERLASIGLVIVNDQYRGYGLGGSLMQACIEAIPEHVPLMLIATTQGEPLYKKLGFRTVSSVYKLLRDSTVIPLPEREVPTKYSIVPFTDELLPALTRLDESSIGADRKQLMEARVQQADRVMVATKPDGSLVGYGMAVPVSDKLVLGPIVGADAAMAVQLIEALAEGASRILRIDIPEGQEELRDLLQQLGFEPSSHPPVMLRNSRQLPPRQGTYFAIASQALG